MLETVEITDPAAAAVFASPRQRKIVLTLIAQDLSLSELAALTGTDVFACGTSYFGVAELVSFAQDTHDFESRYLVGLIGPLPEARELYDTRAPLNNVDGLNCPVLLLQGLDDPIVVPSQAEMFRDALLAKQIPHAYRAYEGESHGFRKLETIVDSREAELSFYGQIMGFTPPGVPVLELWHPGE